MPEQNVNQLVGHLFRHEAGRMAAVLTRIVGLQNLDQAQDIVQDTLLKAMNVWKIKGIPENPSAWLYLVAKRKAIDAIRERKLHHEIESELARAFQSEWTLAPAVQHLFFDHEIDDSQLRMMFACCHPSIPYESQISLTLKTLCGLSVSEIAHSFLTSEETIIKRLYRAREKIRTEKIELEIPAPQAMISRIDAVLHTLYLLFNEEYHSSHPEKLIRHDLCEEAMRLNLLLTNNPLTNLPKTRALLALMCLQASREESRIGIDGHIILLKDQDRKRWDKALIEKGRSYLNAASEGDEISEYHIEAAIAACHAYAESFEQTDWKRILTLYEVLATIKPGAIVEFNKAIAAGYSSTPQFGIELLLKIQGLDENHFYQTALGDFYLQARDPDNAKSHYEIAMRLTKSNSEIKLLKEKITSAAY